MFIGKGRRGRCSRPSLLADASALELGYGRFMQTDPVGYEDGLNWYNYVGGDPVNASDPTGTYADVVVCGGVQVGDACMSRAAFERWYDALEKALGPNTTIQQPDGTYTSPDVVVKAPKREKVDPPCKPGSVCKLPAPVCTIANNYCGPKPTMVFHKPACSNVSWPAVGKKAFDGGLTGEIDGAKKAGNRVEFYALAGTAAGSIEPGGGTLAGAGLGVATGVAKDIGAGAARGAAIGFGVGLYGQCRK